MPDDDLPSSVPPSGAPPQRTTGGGMKWTPPSPEHLQRILPAYEVFSILGQGGMGAVYRAEQRSLHRPVAIKIVPPEAADDEAQFIARFQNEALTMAKMNHPAIVSVYDFGKTPEGQLYFVMEFVDGTDVAQLIKAQGCLPPDRALSVTAHVCDALQYAHDHGVIHRDIKPANILINREGKVKVADFGLAKIDDPSLTSGLTKSHMAMGTPDFVAPEVLTHGVTVDHRADLYAIGVMLYQMLTGEIPRGMFKMPSQKIGSDPCFDAIISRAMESDREQRYQSAAAIRQDLDRMLSKPPTKVGDSQAKAAVPHQQQSAQRGPRVPSRPSADAPASMSASPAAAPPKSKAGLLTGVTAAVVVSMAAVFFFKGSSKPEPKMAEPVVSAPTTSKPQTVAESKPAPPRKPKPASESTVPLPAVSTAPATVDTAPWANATSVLPLVDVEKDTVKEGWKREGDALISGKQQPAFVELPVTPPEEYDLRVSFTKKSGKEGISIVLSRGDRSFAWHGGVYDNTVFGFGNHQGVSGMKASNPTLKSVPVCFEMDRTYTVQIAIRKTGVAAYLDGAKVSELAADLGTMQTPELLKLRAAGLLGIGSFKTSYAVHSIELREVTGKAKLLREPVLATTTVPPPAGALMTPSGVASSSAAVTPVPSTDPVSTKLAELEKTFLDAYEKQVGAPYKAAVADLNTKFSAALDRSVTGASQAGKLDEALVLRNEKTLIQTAGTVPQEDAADTPESLKTLRKTYRASMTPLLANRDKAAVPLHTAYDRALAAFQDELTRASKLDEAARVKAVREHVASQREAAPSMLAATSTPVVAGTAPALGTGSKTPVPVAPTAPPLPASKVLPPPPKATPEEVRALCEWCIGEKKGSVEVMEGGQRRTVESLGQLPKGKLTVTHFYVYELSMNEKDGERKWFTLLGRLPELESMFFHKNPGTMPIEELRGLTKLKSLHLTPTAVDDAAFAHLTGLKSLEELKLTYYLKKFDGTGLGYITDNLRVLEVNAATLTAEGLAYLPRFKKLKRLVINGEGVGTGRNTTLKDTMLQGLAALPDLEELELIETPLAGSFLAYLPANSKLKRLHLSAMKNFKPEHLAHLAKLKNLEDLSLPPVEPDPAGMAAMARLDMLRELSAIGNSSFTGESLKGLKGFKILRSLSLNISPISDAGLEAIANAMPALEHLSMDNDGTNKAALKPDGFSRHLGRLRNLTSLVLAGKGFTDEWLPHIAQNKGVNYLGLPNTTVTDQGVAHLMKLPLGYLRLDGTEVTDAVVPILKTCPTLNNVPTNGSKMTAAGKAEIKKIIDGNKGR